MSFSWLAPRRRSCVLGFALLLGACGRTPLDLDEPVIVDQRDATVRDAVADPRAEPDAEAEADAIEEIIGPCASESYAAQPIPLDVYVMYDQSLSMGCSTPSGSTRWDAVNGAFEGFLSSPASRGIAVGIQYFGLWHAGNMLNSSCVAADYVDPDVEIGVLPDNAAALSASLNAHTPQTNTPTQPALTGALTHARAWAMFHPDHKVVVLLVTDGQPSIMPGCGSTTDPVAEVATIAAQGLSDKPSIPTYVMGVLSPGQDCMQRDPRPPNQADLDRVAAAGGTMSALIVDTGADVTAQFVDGLNQVRLSSVLACTYEIPKPPDGGVIDFTQANVVYEPAAGGAIGLSQVDSAARCDPMAGGWYYDVPAAPKTIRLCPATCGSVSGDAIGQLQITVGCLRPDASAR